MTTPFTTATALQRGISPKRLASSAYRKLFHGVYIGADVRPNLATWVTGARLVLPKDAQPCGLTALQLAGLDYGPILPLHFATAGRANSRRREIGLVQRSNLADVTQPAVALAEYCTQTRLLDGVMAADRAIHRGVVSLEDVQQLAGHPQPKLRQIAGLSRLGAESPQETRVRLALVLAGLPEPRLQVPISDEGGFIGRFDMGYDHWRILIEYEGDQHRDRGQWSVDIVRAEGAEQLGYKVVRITAQLFADPWTQVLRVHEIMRQRGYRGPSPVATPLWALVFGSSQARRSA